MQLLPLIGKVHAGSGGAHRRSYYRLFNNSPAEQGEPFFHSLFDHTPNVQGAASSGVCTITMGYRLWLGF